MEAIRWRFFYGQDNNEKKLSMIGWQKILASKKKGGLGVSTIYGDHSSLDNPGSVSRSSLWCTIICEIGNLSLKGTNLLSHMKKKVGNGIHTSFWGDPWLYDMSLLQVFPRLYALECNKQVSVAVKLSEGSLTDSFRREPRGGIEEEQLLLFSNKLASVTLANSNDRWIWLLDSSGEFLVKSVRSYIDDTLLPTVGFPTRWVKVVPIKINVFAWKVCLDKLPTRLNLSLRGIDIPSIIFPICSSAGESCSHLLFACNMARLLLRKVARWWDLQTPDLNSYDDWLSWFISIRLSKGLKEVLEGYYFADAACRLTFFIVLKFCNASVFLIGMQKQTAGTLKSVQANGRVDYLVDTGWSNELLQRDIGLNLNQVLNKLLRRKPSNGAIDSYDVGNINSQHSPDSIELQSLNATSPLGAVYY
ncbi:RNA-directed DNA polymerase, eukaryota [Tanacetum coccineum]